MVLRSKPVVEIFLTVRTIPDTLEMNSTNFSVQVCVEYRGYDIANKHGKPYEFEYPLIIFKN